MATGKRYYWIKLRETFMTSDTVDFLMSQKDGANYVVLYQMLCLKTINTGGRLSRTIGEIVIPYDVEKIQRDCKWFSADTIRVALNLYKRFGLIYEERDGTLVLSDHDSMVGSETDYAEKNRRIRARQQETLPETGHIVSDDVSPNVPIDIRDIDTRDKSLDTRVKEKENTEEEEERAREEVDPQWDSFVKEYEQNIGLMPYQQYELEALSADYEILGADVMSEAIKATALAHPDNPHTYLRRVCQKWIEVGITTVDQAKAAMMDFQRRKAEKNRGGGTQNGQQDRVNAFAALARKYEEEGV